MSSHIPRKMFLIAEILDQIRIEHFSFCRAISFVAFIGSFAPSPAIAESIYVESTPCGEGPIEEVLIPGGIQRIYSPESDDESVSREFIEVEVRQFCIAVQELTVERYLDCLKLGPCKALRVSSKDIKLPINSLSYAEVQTFIKWYSDHNKLDYRLPSEAEWQAAAVPDYESPNSWLNEFLNSDDSVFTPFVERSDANQPNSLGVRNIIGNVSEFVADCFVKNIGQIPRDGTPAFDSECQFRLIKGGDTRSPAFALDPYFRFPVQSSFVSPRIGFRLVRSLD